MTRPAALLLLAGCTLAHAGSDADRIVLKDGRVFTGTVTDTRDGRYAVLVDGGDQESFAYGEIARVERTRGGNFDGFKAGFEIVGLGIGPRLSWERESGPIRAFGVRGGLMLVPMDGYPYPLAWGAFAVDWLDHSPVQIETTLGFSTSSYYPGFIGGVAARIAPEGTVVRMNVGVLASVDVPYLYYPVLIPDVGVSFLW